MTAADFVAHVTAELALFAGAGFLLFAINDLAVDLIYFARRGWRALTVYSRYPRLFASDLVASPTASTQGQIAVFIPAWDESQVIAPMLKATLRRLSYSDYRLFVGHYRNDPATAAAIASVADPRIEPVLVDIDGPTTKADCLNHLYDA
jgi:adsorption protein B